MKKKYKRLKEIFIHNTDVINNLSWLLFDKIFRMGGGLLVGILVAKYMGPSDFGLFNFTFSFVWLFSHIVTMGLDEIVLKDLITTPESKNRILGTATVLKVIGGLIAFLLILVSAHFVKKPDNSFLVLTVTISVSMILKNIGVLRLFFESTLNSKYNVLSENFGFIAVSVFRIYLVSVKSELISFGYALILEVFVCAFFLLFYHKKHFGSFIDLSFDKSVAKQMLQNSWPLILSGISVMIYVKSDQFLLGILSGNYQTGLYSVAARISEIWYFIPVAVVASVFPKIIEAKKESVSEYEKKMKHLFRILIYSSIIIAIVMTFSCKYIVLLLFGTEYLGSSMPLSIHIWVGVFVFIGIASSKILILENVQKVYLIQTVLGALSNVILNIFLIPSYGAIGASIATFLSYGLSFLVWFFSVKTRYLGLIVIRSLFLR